MNLNEQQKAIVSTLGGRVAVVAGAGSGKTTTTMELISKLHLVNGIPLEKMFISTFTNKAGRDLKSKLKRKLNIDNDKIEKLWIGTFHSLGFRYLTQIKKMKLNIILPIEAEHYLKNIYRQVIKDEGEEENIVAFKSIQDSIEKYRNTKCSWDKVSPYPEICQKVHNIYQKEKSDQNIIDFNDILFIFAEQLKIDPMFSSKFSWVFVDECFEYNTPVLIDYDKWVSIGDIVENPEIYKEALSYDLLSKKILKKPIISGIKHLLRDNKTFVRLKLKTENGEICYIQPTENHKMIVYNKGEVLAKDVEVGDRFINFDIDIKNLKRVEFCESCSDVVKLPHFCKNLSKKVCPICGDSVFNLKKHHYWKHTASDKIKEKKKKRAKNFWESDRSFVARKTLSEYLKKNNPMHRLEIRKKVGESVSKTFWEKSEKERDIIVKRFMDAPKYSKKPNNLEKSVIKEHIDNLYFTGDGSYFVTLEIEGKLRRKNPDFIYVPFKCGTCEYFSKCSSSFNVQKTYSCNKWVLSRSYRSNKVVELMDFEYWHTLEEAKDIVKAYRKKNIDCLVLDAKETLIDKRSKIESFINNHYVTIIEKKIFNKKQVGSNSYVYDINVSDTHTFFVGAVSEMSSQQKRTPGLYASNIITPILVHNCQDNNEKQIEIANLLSSKNSVFVGDNKQAIYGFRGSAPHLFKEMSQTADKVYPLSYNYRSTPQIINFANLLLKQMPQFKGQDLIATASNGALPVFTLCDNSTFQTFKAIKDDIRKGIPLDEIAVLSRSVKPATVQGLLVLLRREGIPYALRGGDDKLNASYIQNYLSVLKSVVNPTKVSLVNAFGILPSVGPKTAMKLAETVVSNDNSFDVLKKDSSRYCQTKAFTDYLNLVSIKQDNKELLLRGLDFIYEHHLISHYGKKDKAEPSNKKNIIYDILYEYLLGFKTVSDGIDSLYINEDDVDSDKGKIVVSTIHQSKGLEWDSVHIMNMNEFGIPFLKPEDEEDFSRLEEEFCLAYVACTRARKHLKMYMQFMSGQLDWSKPNKLSRYIKEIYKSTQENYFTFRVLDVENEQNYKKMIYDKATGLI